MTSSTLRRHIGPAVRSTIYLVMVVRAVVAHCEMPNLVRPRITKLGTVDQGLVETTPIVFHDVLYRFESVRRGYWDNKLGAPYFRFINVATRQATEPFAKSHDLGSALVVGDTMYVLGTPGWVSPAVDVFWSKDLKTWESKRALDLPGWELFNTSVCRADDRYVMAFEVGAPPEIVGVRFTNRFAESKDMLNWTVLPEPAVFTKDRYSACPAIRWCDGWFYMIYLEIVPADKQKQKTFGEYNSYIVRSRDLSDWQTSPFNPVIQFDELDKRVANDKLTAAQREKIKQALNLNNSDIDLCEWNGRVVINYAWGDQMGTEFLAKAVYEGTLDQFLKGFFPDDDGK